MKIGSVALLISLVWTVVQFRKKLLRENIKLMERAKLENHPGGDEMRSYFRSQWNSSIGKLDFLSAVIIMAVFYRINREFYRGVFNLYEEGIEEYLEPGSTFATLNKIFKSARES